MGRGLPARTSIGRSPPEGRTPTNGLGDESGPDHVRIANTLQSKRRVRGLQVVRSVVLFWAVHGPFPRSGSRPGVHAGMNREVPHVSGPFDGSSRCLGLSLCVPSPLCMTQARKARNPVKRDSTGSCRRLGTRATSTGPITAARARAVNGPDKTEQSSRLRDCSWRHPEKCTTSKTLVGGKFQGQPSPVGGGSPTRPTRSDRRSPLPGADGRVTKCTLLSGSRLAPLTGVARLPPARLVRGQPGYCSLFLAFFLPPPRFFLIWAFCSSVRTSIRHSRISLRRSIIS